MTVFRRTRNGVRAKVYEYKFVVGGTTYRGTTGQISKAHAEAFERKERDRIRQIAYGVADDLPRVGLSFTEWAEHFYEIKARTLTRPDALEWHLRAVLRFFGRRPPERAKSHDATAPYHDLALTDVIRDPYWLERFEAWMHERAISPHTRNHWRSTLSQLFAVAMDVRYRSRTGVTSNPAALLRRDAPAPRTATATPEQIRAILQHASYHVRLAIAIGLLAPTLRVASILALRWDEHFDPSLTRLTVTKHKTASKTRRPQVYPIPEQLRAILIDARRRTRSVFVITYRGRRLKTIDDGFRGAVESAGLRYGIKHPDGLTFHSLRHSASSMFAMHNVSPFTQRELMGHATLDMTAYYTHADQPALRAAAEGLSSAFTVADLVTAPQRRARRGAHNGDHSTRDATQPARTQSDNARRRPAPDQDVSI